jgi:hypothetical protein
LNTPWEMAIESSPDRHKNVYIWAMVLTSLLPSLIISGCMFWKHQFSILIIIIFII